MTASSTPSPTAWATFRLPSLGYFYDGKLPNGEIGVRKMTAREESILQTQGLDGTDRINMIVANCIRLPDDFEYVLPGTDRKVKGVDALLTTDKLAALLFQRTFTFGPNYTYTFRCQACRANNRATCNIIEDFDYVSPETLLLQAERDGVALTLEEPFEVRLLDAGLTVRCRLLRGVDEREIFRRANKAKLTNLDPTDPSYIARLSAQIVDVEGMDWPRLDAMRKEMWLRSITAADSARIRIETERRQTALDTDVSPSCRACGAVNEMPLQFDVEFFLPSRL